MLPSRLRVRRRRPRRDQGGRAQPLRVGRADLGGAFGGAAGTYQAKLTAGSKTLDRAVQAADRSAPGRGGAHGGRPPGAVRAQRAGARAGDVGQPARRARARGAGGAAEGWRRRCREGEGGRGACREAADRTGSLRQAGAAGAHHLPGGHDGAAWTRRSAATPSSDTACCARSSTRSVPRRTGCSDPRPRAGRRWGEVGGSPSGGPLTSPIRHLSALQPVGQLSERGDSRTVDVDVEPRRIEQRGPQSRGPRADHVHVIEISDVHRCLRQPA